MKRFTLIAVVLISWLSTLSYAQSPAEAAKYMGEIGNEYQNISRESWQYMSAVARGKNSRKIDKRRQDLSDAIKQAIYRVGRIGGFQGDVNLRDSVVAYLNLSYRVFNEDYDKILDMEEIAEESFDNMEAYMTAKEKAHDLLDAASERVDATRNEFAAKYNLNIVEGEESRLSQKLSRANKAFKYYNQHYLIFFKTYKQDAYVMDALNSGDVSAMEQNNRTLLKFAQESREQLHSVSRYGSDGALKVANIQVQDHYQRQAEQYMPTIIEFYLKKEKFDRLKASIDGKKPKDRSKEEVAAFNKAIDEYNNGIKEYNRALENLNKARAQALENWNRAVDSFLQRQAA
jgi:hypothetical protein